MADNLADANVNKNKVKSLTNNSTVLNTDKIITPNVEDQYDLRWPTSQDRDLTQIINTEDVQDLSRKASNCDGHGHDGEPPGEGNEGIELIKQCPEMKKMQPKKTRCYSAEEKKIFFINHKKPTSNSSNFYGNKPKKKPKLKTLSSPELADAHGSHKLSYWNVFSDELILGIFSFLNKKNLCVCAKVCKRWRRLAYDESLWHSLDLTGLTWIGEDVLRLLFMRSVLVMRLAWLKVLSSEKCETSDESNTECEEDELYGVEYLDASSSSIKENVLSRSLLKCRNLKKLSLESCSVSTGILRAIGRCNQLSVLNLCMCRQITKSGLRSLASGDQRIRELNLGWTNMTPESIATVVKNFPLLTKLNLSGCRETLRDEAVADLLSTCRNLTCLDLSDCIEISELSVKSVVKHGRMKHLALSRCYGITPKCLESLSTLKTLRTLQVFGFLTDPGLSVLKKVLTGIQINGNMFSTIARPTGSVYTEKIWGMKCLGRN